MYIPALYIEEAKAITAAESTAQTSSAGTLDQKQQWRRCIKQAVGRVEQERGLSGAPLDCLAECCSSLLFYGVDSLSY